METKNRLHMKAVFSLLSIIWCSVNLNPFPASNAGWRSVFVVMNSAIAAILVGNITPNSYIALLERIAIPANKFFRSNN